MTRSLVDEGRNVLWIAKCDPVDERGRLLRTYVRLLARGRLRGLLRSSGAREEQILGWRVEFFEYSWLLHMFEEIFIRQQYFLKTPKTHPFIVDCGSNIGLSILYFKTLFPEARILAFEPDPETFQVLKRNVERNELHEVRLVNKAVRDSEGRVELYRDLRVPGSPRMTTSCGRELESPIAVDTTLLSRYIDEKVDLLKLDVEGDEVRVLRDLSGEDKLQLTERIVLEYHHHMDPDRDLLSEVLSLLESHNFGYQLEGRLRLGETPEPRQYQNLMIYAYRKGERETPS